MVEVWDDAAKELAVAAAQQWAGTPWANRRCQLGKGVDCIHFVKSILEASEIIPPTSLPFYKASLGFRADQNVMEAAILECLHCERAGGDFFLGQPRFGDLIIWRCGASSNHIGIMLDHPWHVRTHSVVAPTPYKTIEHEVQSILRITQRGLRSEPCRRINT